MKGLEKFIKFIKEDDKTAAPKYRNGLTFRTYLKLAETILKEEQKLTKEQKIEKFWDEFNTPISRRKR